MKIDQVLKRIGAVLVRAENKPGQLQLFLRAGTEPMDKARWKVTIEEFLSAAAENKARTDGWSADVSQVYYRTKEGAVRYLWRVIITGNGKPGAEAFGNAVIRSLGHGSEVTSMPLIGRVKYDYAPEKGLIKGGHDPKVAMSLITAGLSEGKTQ